MDDRIKFDYYYGIEAEQFSFYRIPRLLIKDARFRELSSDAKLLYGLMLVKDGLVKREKKQIVPTADGMKLITVLPDVVKSPKLTADWENALTLVAKGELPMGDFMADIENMVSEMIHTYHEVSDEQKKMFAQEQTVLGTCPNCGGQVVKGKFGAYCVKECGMNVSRLMGAALTDAQVKDLLAGKKKSC